jgi:hypothetical protein
MKRQFVLKAAAALIGIWTCVWLATRAADASMPSARRLLAFLEKNPLVTDSREEALRRVATEYNKLGFVDRRALRAAEAKGVFTRFVGALTPEEKARFVDLVMPAGFDQLLDGFSRLPERDRLKTLERSKRELLDHLPDSPASLLIEQADAQLLNKIASDGFGEFYRQLPPEAKLEMLPFIEQIQNNLRKLND